MAPHKHDDLCKQLDAALREHARSNAQQRSNHSPAHQRQPRQAQQSQSQQPQSQSQPQQPQSQGSHYMNPQHAYYYPGMQHNVHNTQYPQQYAGAYPYPNPYGYAYGGYAYAPQTAAARNSYLSSTGTPFDLHSSTQAGRQSGSYMTSYNALQPELNDSRASRGTTYQRSQKATTRPRSHNVGSSPSQNPLTASTSTQATPNAAPKAAVGGWGDFETQIKQDDKKMAMKARENLDRLGGETFRPEFKETYEDRKGRKEETVHEKVGGSEAEKQSDEESVYDTDSSGGVAL